MSSIQILEAPANSDLASLIGPIKTDFEQLTLKTEKITEKKLPHPHNPQPPIRLNADPTHPQKPVRERMGKDLPVLSNNPADGPKPSKIHESRQKSSNPRAS